MARAHLARRYVERPAEVETPFSIMRFRLTYDGVLRSLNRRKSWAPIKWDIREQISAQLSELYDVHPTIGMRQRIIMPGGLGIPGSFDLTNQTGTYIMSAYDVVRDPIMVETHSFIPLVRKSLAISCSLDVLFLRRQVPGKLLSGGDIDNRMQILFDALRMPDNNELSAGLPPVVPGYYLLEDDSLVTSISIKTDRLLSPKGGDRNHALLLIDVTISIMQLTPYNVVFIGD